MTGQGLTMKIKVSCLSDWIPFFAEGASKDPRISNLRPSRTHYEMLLFIFPPLQYQTPYSTNRQSLCQRGRPRHDRLAADLGTAMKRRMGTTLWSRGYREAAQDHAYRVPVVHSGATVGVSHTTSLGSASPRKQGCGLTHLLLRECTSFQPKSFLRGHWRTRAIT